MRRCPAVNGDGAHCCGGGRKTERIGGFDAEEWRLHGSSHESGDDQPRGHARLRDEPPTASYGVQIGLIAVARECVAELDLWTVGAGPGSGLNYQPMFTISSTNDSRRRGHPRVDQSRTATRSDYTPPSRRRLSCACRCRSFPGYPSCRDRGRRRLGAGHSLSWRGFRR